MQKATSIPMEGGGYAFGEKVVVRLHCVGSSTYLWVGLDNKNGSCLGVMQGLALQRLAEAILQRKRGSRTAVTPNVGRTAAPLTAFRPDGRRRG